MKKQAQTTYFFYQDGKITTVQEGQLHRAIFRAVNVPLAEQKTADAKDTSLLAIDGKNSIFTAQNAHGDEAHSFTAYGHNPTLSSAKTLLGYNGEQHASEDLYILGRGTRCYSTKMGRFLSPDAFSPFGRGGINAYAYCNGDPINYFDDSGNMRRSTLRTGGNKLTNAQRQAVTDTITDKVTRQQILRLEIHKKEIQLQQLSNQEVELKKAWQLSSRNIAANKKSISLGKGGMPKSSLAELNKLHESNWKKLSNIDDSIKKTTAVISLGKTEFSAIISDLNQLERDVGSEFADIYNPIYDRLLASYSVRS
ncbi:TPA: hypothetical protein SMP92_004661 [Pseudomonas putida]|nr:hypothetical protein [Pseudomonas putida]